MSDNKITTVTPDSREAWGEFLDYVVSREGTVHEFDDRISEYTEAWLGDVTYTLDSETNREWAEDAYWSADANAVANREWVQ